jgi:4-hydroxy-tetrahydrodipicolinate reductase
MGTAVCAAVATADDLELAAAIDPKGGHISGVEVLADREHLRPADLDVAVDFTVATAARENLAWCAEHGVHAVCGTTGFTEEGRAELARAFPGSGGANCVLAPNLSVGAVLMMRCAQLCAPYFEGIEVIELHHDHKRDAPSGTALETVSRIEAARSGPLRPDPTQHTTMDHTRGARSEGGVHVHSVRLPGLLAHQEVLFGATGETLTIRHDSTDRLSFMPGVLLAVRRVASTPGLTFGLDSLLGF